MPRSKTYKVSCLNITAHPHDDPKTYVNLMTDLAKIKFTKIFGDTCGTIRYLQLTDLGSDGIEYMTGSFVRFTNLDPKAGWFNADDKTDVDTEIDGKPFLPINLKPNRRDTVFIFFPTSSCHKLFFISNEFTPNLAKTFLKRLANDDSITSKYGEVNIEIVTSSDAIEEILRLNFISSLLIEVNMPNDDVMEECEQEHIDRMKAQGVGKMLQKMRPLRGHKLDPDTGTIALMKVATVYGNGFIEASGEDPDTGLNVSVSSKNYPKTKSFEVMPNDATPFMIRFLNCVREWIDNIRN